MVKITLEKSWQNKLFSATSFQLVCNVTKFFGHVTITLQKIIENVRKKSYNFIFLCNLRVNSFSIKTVMSKLNISVLTTHF